MAKDRIIREDRPGVFRRAVEKTIVNSRHIVVIKWDWRYEVGLVVICLLAILNVILAVGWLV